MLMVGVALGSSPQAPQVRGHHFRTLGNFPHRTAVFFLITHLHVLGFILKKFAINVVFESLHSKGRTKHSALHTVGQEALTPWNLHLL
jgi:hypothetical protein